LPRCPPAGCSQYGSADRHRQDPDSGLPAAAVAASTVLVVAPSRLDAEIERPAKASDAARRLMTVLGWPLIATAIAVLAPPSETFRKAGDLAASPHARRHSTAGKQRPGATTRMGERSLQHLARSRRQQHGHKRHVHASARPSTWRGGMSLRKPPLLVHVALANRMARIASGPDGPRWRLQGSGRDGANRSSVARTAARACPRNGLARSP